MVRYDIQQFLCIKVWDFSQAHPDGFTINIHTMTEPTEGIAVSYAATQNSHSRDQLDKVVSHALQHEGYVGGWYNSEDGLPSCSTASTNTDSPIAASSILPTATSD